MNNRFKLLFTTIFIVILSLVIGTFLGIFYQQSYVRQDLQEQVQNNKLLYTIELLKSKYVDKINEDSLYEVIMPQLLSTLDPHSVYIPAGEISQANEPLEGKFDGIGVLFNMATDTAIVMNVISGGPSSKSGVMAGDKIITVNDSIIAGVKRDQNKVVSMLRGKRGTVVTLGIKRGQNKTLVPIKVVRGEIPMKSVEAAFIIEPGVGFVRIARFAATTFNEFSAALSQLKKEGMKKLIIDLRDNGGGYLEPAIDMANEFLPNGAGIVYTQGESRKRQDQFADGRGRYQDMPVTILIGPESASASEVFAGAMQDNDRAVIVGLRSFGKGLIQEQFQFNDSSAARITIAHYYTPLGRSIQKDYVKGEKDNYQLEIYNRYSHNEFLNEDSIKKDETKKVMTKGGKVLYGGGGIHPDIFVPMDTSKVDNYFRKLYENNLVFRYSMMYTEKNRAKINDITNFAQLDKLFASANLFMDFVAWASRQGVSPSGKELEDNRNIIEMQLKAYIGRNTKLDDNALYYYQKSIDKTLQKGIETFLVD